MLAFRRHCARRGARAFVLGLALVPVLAFAQSSPELTADAQACLTRELATADFTAQEIDNLFAGLIPNPEAFVKGRIGEEGIRTIAQTCFPGDFETPSPAESPAPVTITPEQRACVTQYVDADLLDRMLRGEVRPEDVLTQEHMRTIGQNCFAAAAPAPGVVPPPIDLPPGVLECLKREVGERAVAEVMSGQRQPTPEEYAQGETCFPRHPPGGPGAGGVPDLPETTRQCIRSIIGDTFDRVMELARTGGRPESLLTPEEMRRVGEQCFGGHPGGPPGGPPSVPAPELPPGVRACLEGLFGAGRVAELLTGRSQPTPEETQKAQSCFADVAPGPTGPPGSPEQCVQQCVQYGGRPESECRDLCAGRPGPSPASCVDECVTYRAADGTTYSREQCAQFCAGQPPPVPTGPSPPTGSPPGGDEQCVSQCRAHEGGRYNVGDFCERACRGEPVQPPGEPTPYPTTEPPPAPEPTPYPTPDTTQCVASCTGYTSTQPDGTTRTYTEDECRQICSGGSVQGAEAASPSGRWWTRLLLRLVGL